MPNAEAGGFVYVEFTALTNVSSFVSIKKSIDHPDVTCEVKTGSIVLLRHPYKMYISFQSIEQEAKFWFNAYYSPTLEADEYVNEEICSDQSILGEIQKPEPDPVVDPDPVP